MGTDHRDMFALTDADFLALGKIVANWAMAEYVFLTLLRFTHQHPAVVETDFATEPLGQFARAQKNWKSVIKLVCATHPWQREVGLFLASHGKGLKNERDMACHWPAIRNAGSPEQHVYFVDNTDFERRAAFDEASLSALAQEIDEWLEALNMFGFIIGKLLPSSGETSDREIPGWMLEGLDSYRKNHRKPRIPTKPKRPGPLSS